MRLRHASGWVVGLAMAVALASCVAPAEPDEAPATDEAPAEEMAVATEASGDADAAGAAIPQPTENTTRTTVEEVEGWIADLSNWGRWGDDDELGALNLITPEKRLEAVALVETGQTASLAHDWITEPAVDAAEPFELNVFLLEPTTMGIAMETQELSYHGSTFSHLDALCHVSHNGQLYNGRDFAATVSAEGCAQLGIGNVKEGIVTRGVLLDIPRLKGVPYLEAGEQVYREDVEAWEQEAGIMIEPGDAVFLYTGRWKRRAEQGPFGELAGFDASVIPLLKERDIALLGSDGFQEAGALPGMFLPVHKFTLVALGVNLLDNQDLEALAEMARSHNRWEFMLVVGPLRVEGGAGSPTNPIAIF